MSAFRIANAPCSWGVLEFEGRDREPIGFRQMLDELRDAGYTGTELGDWGFMPNKPPALRTELATRGLSMVGAFVPVYLRDPSRHPAGADQAIRTARLLAAVADGDGAPAPLIVLADESGTDPIRFQNAGRITADMGMTDQEWRLAAECVNQIARQVHDTTGLRTAFHHHCAGWIETPDEVARLLDMTDPTLVGLTFDTGHYLFGSGGNDPQVVLDGLDRFADRIWHVHFKDCDPAVATRARVEGLPYDRAVEYGIFSELGQGGLDFRPIVDWLRRHAYQGWIVVEQDVLTGMGEPRASAERNRKYLASIGV